MNEPNSCEKCFSCQMGVSPTITIDDIKKNDGKIKPEWTTKEVQENCQNCYSCEKCFTSQN